MAWGRTDEQKPSVTKEEFDDFSQKVPTRDDFEGLKTTFNSALDEIKTSLAGLSVREAPVVKTETQASVDEFDYADPTAYINKRTNAVANVAVETKASLEEMRARTRRAKEFALWGKEIDELAQKDGLGYRAQTQYWDNLCDMVRGRHAADIEEKAAKGEMLFTESSTGSSVNYDSGKPRLTDSEKLSAKKFGMSDEDWAKNREPFVAKQIEREDKRYVQ